MKFAELEYPISPILRRVLLWEKSIPGYTCLIFNCPDTPHLVVKINGREFAVKVSSIFQTIIKIAKIKPQNVATKVEEVKDANHIGDGS